MLGVLQAGDQLEAVDTRRLAHDHQLDNVDLAIGSARLRGVKDPTGIRHEREDLRHAELSCNLVALCEARLHGAAR